MGSSASGRTSRQGYAPTCWLRSEQLSSSSCLSSCTRPLARSGASSRGWPGTILKRDEEGDVQGLTTAAGIWLTAAVGVAIGMGGIGIALVATLLTWFILSVVARIERWLSGQD